MGLEDNQQRERERVSLAVVPARGRGSYTPRQEAFEDAEATHPDMPIG